MPGDPKKIGEISIMKVGVSGSVVPIDPPITIYDRD